MGVAPAELAQTLVERERKKREEHARRAAELKARLSEWAHRAQQALLIKKAWLIGSLAWGTYGEASDVDVVVEGLSHADEARTWLELADWLDSQVDLLRLEDLPESFAKRVRAEGVPLA